MHSPHNFDNALVTLLLSKEERDFCERFGINSISNVPTKEGIKRICNARLEENMEDFEFISLEDFLRLSLSPDTSIPEIFSLVKEKATFFYKFTHAFRVHTKRELKYGRVIKAEDYLALKLASPKQTQETFEKLHRHIVWATKEYGIKETPMFSLANTDFYRKGEESLSDYIYEDEFAYYPPTTYEICVDRKVYQLVSANYSYEAVTSLIRSWIHYLSGLNLYEAYTLEDYATISARNALWWLKRFTSVDSDGFIYFEGKKLLFRPEITIPRLLLNMAKIYSIDLLLFFGLPQPGGEKDV